MKIEKQVCSLELAKKLKKLGVKQGGYFNWIEENAWGSDWETRVEVSNYDFDCPITIFASSFTVAELGELLPDVLYLDKTPAWLEYSKIKNEHYACYRVGCAQPRLKYSATSEANARAKLLIYLLKNNLLNK